MTTAAEARGKWVACVSLMETLADEFPCEKCDGRGDLFPGGCYTPCDECWGRGFSIPEEDE